MTAKILEDFLKENEIIDDLQRDGLKIIQNKKSFSYGVDSVLIANFAGVRKGDLVADLGTGTGIISILLSAKTEAKKIIGVEIQPEIAEMAQRSVKMNALEERIEIICDDIRNYALSNLGKFDVVVSNPPYFKVGAAILNESSYKMLSRHEINLNVEELFESTSKLLKQGGRFYLIHRPDRLVDLFYYSRKYKLEAKKIKPVKSKLLEKPKLLIIEFVKGAGSELKWVEPLIIYDENGEYTEQIHKIYSESKISSFENK